MRRRRWVKIGILAIALGAMLLGFMYDEALRDPVARTVTIPIAGIDRPVRIALLSDTHMSGPDMPPERLARIVAAVNGQKPDLILLAGDYMGNDKPFGARFSPVESVAPFAALRARLGMVAVLGNHDYWGQAAAPLRRAFAGLRIALLENGAVRRGPLVIGGIADVTNGRPDLPGTIAAMRRLGGAPVLIAHSPDVFPDLGPDMPLTLVGHTHCGQVRLPVVGALWVPSRYGTRFACGRYDADGRTMIVGGGVGTSGLPIRLLNPPEYWMIMLVPKPMPAH